MIFSPVETPRFSGRLKDPLQVFDECLGHGFSRENDGGRVCPLSLRTEQVKTILLFSVGSNSFCLKNRRNRASQKLARISAMIINGKKVGQLGNRLFLFAHLIAAAEEYGVPLVNPAFAEYAKLFPATSRDLWCRYPAVRGGQLPTHSVARNAVSKAVELGGRGLNCLGGRLRNLEVIRLRSGQELDLGGKHFANLVAAKHVLLQGWLFRSERLLQKHASQVRQHFDISSGIKREIHTKIAELREQTEVVVGIHIRHGDYASYLNGKYFYSLQQYATVMEKITEQLSPKRVGFLVCGNSSFDHEDFKGLHVLCGAGGVIEDLYAFAEVDLLIGPPSTFTGWASFYGNVPLHWLESVNNLADVSGLIRDGKRRVA